MDFLLIYLSATLSGLQKDSLTHSSCLSLNSALICSILKSRKDGYN